MKNENLKRTKLIFLFFLFTGSFTSLSAQDDLSSGDRSTNIIYICQGGTWRESEIPPHRSSCNETEIWGEGDGIMTEITIAAYAAYLNNEGETPVFPENLPDPYLGYEFDEGAYKFINVKEGWEAISVEAIPDGTIFRSTRKVAINIPTGLYCQPGIDQDIKFQMDLDLYYWNIKAQPPRYDPYPIHLHAEKDETFSCNFFVPTKHLCDPEGTTEAVPRITSVPICIDCYFVGGDLIHSGGRENGNEKEQFLVTPNPFTSSLEYFYTTRKEGTISVQLISNIGEILQIDNKNVIIGENRFFIDGSNLAPGVYFLKILNGDKTSIKKVIKI